MNCPICGNKLVEGVLTCDNPECVLWFKEEDDVALEMELARWRRENPLPEPEDDGRPW